VSKTRTPSEQIVEEVTSWPGVAVGPGRRGELAIRLGGRELGHLHGSHAAHFGFPKQVWAELRKEGRIVPHPVFPTRRDPGRAGSRRKRTFATSSPSSGSTTTGRLAPGRSFRRRLS
jgi:hypothetical protein